MFYSANGKFTKKSIKEGFLDVFQGYVHKHEETELDEIKSDVDNLKDKANDLSDEFKSSKRNFYALYDKVSDFDQKFNDLDQVQDEMEQQINEMNYFEGNVGIGTPPHNDYKLDVNGGINVNLKSGTEQQKNSKAINVYKNFTGVVNGNYIGKISGTDANIEETGVRFLEKGGDDFRSNQTKVLNVLSNNDSKMVVTGSGNVGIGTNNPAYKLDVNGDIRIPQAYSSTDPNNPAAGKSNKLLFYSNPGFGEAGINYVGGPKGAERNESYLNLFTSGSNKMTIKNNGNVGIGTTRPLTKLQVGNIGYIRKDNIHGTNNAVTIAIPKATSNSVLNDPQDALILTRPGTSNQAWQSQAHMRLSRYENSGSNSRTRLDFGLLHGNGGTNAQTGSAPNNVMTLLSNGNVGIGKTNPGEKLEVSGKVKANEFCVGNICLTSDDISKIKNL